MDNKTSPTKDIHTSALLALPAEIRIAILEYVFDANVATTGLTTLGTTILDETYSASKALEPLLTCRQIHHDAHLLAYTRTAFLTTSLYTPIPARLTRLKPKQIASIRRIAFVVDANHFRALTNWTSHPFNLPTLHLTDLTLILHRSSVPHFLYDHTQPLVTLLRALQNTQRITIVRNAAVVKGGFGAWCHRLIGLILKVDHAERYLRTPPRLETTWWTWGFEREMQVFWLEAREARGMVGEEEYMRMILPLVEGLREGVEGEM